MVSIIATAHAFNFTLEDARRPLFLPLVDGLLLRSIALTLAQQLLAKILSYKDWLLISLAVYDRT